MRYEDIDKTNWTKENIAWLAGLSEGECYIAKNKIFFRIRMTDEDVIEKCRIFGIGNFRGPVEGNPKKKHKPIYEWTITRKQHFEELLLVLLPLMGQRRQSTIRSCFRKTGICPERE
jgi:hypothetical protein